MKSVLDFIAGFVFGCFIFSGIFGLVWLLLSNVPLVAIVLMAAFIVSMLRVVVRADR